MCFEPFFVIDRKQLHQRPKCKRTALQYELSGEECSPLVSFLFYFFHSLYEAIRLEDSCISSAPLSYSVFKCGSNQWLGILSSSKDIADSAAQNHQATEPLTL